MKLLYIGMVCWTSIKAPAKEDGRLRHREPVSEQEPKGSLHTYKNVGTTPGKMLVSQTPGGLHERFFEEIGQEAQDKFKPTAHEGQLDAERIVTIAATYGIEIPPPTPSR
jgi:hypothetical protein